MSEKSPYMKKAGRLADVVAAIQVLGAYKFYKLTPEGWAERITGDGKRAEYWRTVFEQHPEFFRFDEEKAKVSLVWRRQAVKRFHVDKGLVMSDEQVHALPPEESERVTREPLSSDDIRALIDTAISLHARALEQKRDARWWIPLASALGALIGSAAGTAAKLL
jgi:hypothetical protein